MFQASQNAKIAYSYTYLPFYGTCKQTCNTSAAGAANTISISRVAKNYVESGSQQLAGQYYSSVVHTFWLFRNYCSAYNKTTSTTTAYKCV